MAVTRECSVREHRAVLDVAAGEFLEYQLTFRGAQASFIVVDDVQDVLTPDDRISPSAFGAQWHPVEGWDGADTHNFRGSMILAESYTLRITVCHKSGNTKQVIRQCKYTRTKNTDVAVDSLRVYSK